MRKASQRWQKRTRKRTYRRRMPHSTTVPCVPSLPLVSILSILPGPVPWGWHGKYARGNQRAFPFEPASARHPFGSPL